LNLNYNLIDYCSNTSEPGIANLYPVKFDKYISHLTLVATLQDVNSFTSWHCRSIAATYWPHDGFSRWLWNDGQDVVYIHRPNKQICCHHCRTIRGILYSKWL